MTLDDVRIFFAITKELDPESGQPINIQQALRRQHVTNWRPGQTRIDTTVVTMINGTTVILDHKFSEFHAWVIGPAAERDKRLKELGLKKSPGRPKTKKDDKEEDMVGG